MKKIFYVALSLFLLSGCYDDTRIWEELRDHEERLQKLEALCAQVNSDVASLQELVSAIETGDYITDVRPYRENGVDVGYEITFSRKKSIVIYHGRDGEDGKDGSSVSGGNLIIPVIGVKTDTDGGKYWTVGGEWLLDETGAKVSAVGKAGEDGQDGAAGEKGEDGVTPKFKIEDDYWYVSYEDGADGSWQRLGKAVGEDGADGADGEDGSDGLGGSPLFESVGVSEDGMYVTFTLVSGDVFQVPTLAMIEDLAQALGDLAEACLIMNDNIEALSEIIMALQNNVYVTSVTKIMEDGEEIGYTLDFSDGTSATIYHGKDGENGKDGAPGKDGEDGEDGKDGTGSIPEIGVRQDTDGIYYWTVNGEWLLDGAGQKVAASGSGSQSGQGPQGPQGDPGKDGVTPKLKIENDYWYVSYDEGQTWEELGKATGEDGKDGADGENGADGNDGQDGVSGGACIFSDVQVADDAVVLILADGTEIVLPRTCVDQSVLGLSQQSFYLRYEAAKALQLTAEGIEEYCVMSKPDGWRASFDGTTLNILSPTKKAVAAGVAELSGEIIIHATTQAGKCKTAKVEVEAGPGIVLEVDVKGNLAIENSYYGYHGGWGEPEFGFMEVAIGIAASEGFLTDPTAYVDNVINQWMLPTGDCYTYIYNFWSESKPYVEGEYETDILTGNVAELYEYAAYEELGYGPDLVVWAAPVDEKGLVVADDVVFVEYNHLRHDVKVAQVTHNDVVLSLDCEGASSYIVSCLADDLYDSFESYMRGQFDYWTQGVGWTTIGTEIPAASLGEEIVLSEIQEDKLLYGSKYWVWVMPLFEGKQPGEYDFDKNFLPYVFEVRTNDIIPGGDLAAAYTLVGADYTSITVNVALSEETDVVHYKWYSKDNFDSFNGDMGAVRADLLEGYSIKIYKSDTLIRSNCRPDESYVLASCAIGKDGTYGNAVCGTYNTLEPPHTADIKVELETCAGVWGTPEITVKVTGADKVIGWLPYGYDEEDDYRNFVNNVCRYGHEASRTGFQMADVTDGEAVLTFSRSSAQRRYYYIAAYNVENGMVSGICENILKVDLDDPAASILLQK